MTEDTLHSVTADFLIRLRKIDKHILSVRDVLVIYVVLRNPGISGVEIASKLGLVNRSSIASNLARLLREGYIEDHRQVRRKANATILHITPKGLAFWDEIKP